MGTRGVTGFVADGKWYVTYNHFDSYPEYLGMLVLEFCKGGWDWEAVKENVRKVKLVGDRDVPTEEEIYHYACFSNLDVSTRSLTDWYCLLRNLQGVNILYAIARDDVEHMIDNHKFMADSLFCEWGYIIDLDDMTLKVYKGFNEKLINDTPLPPDVFSGVEEEGYYPVKMLHAYSLNRLPKFMLGVTNKFKEEYALTH